jgi:large subunit ribosomal protein L10
LQDQLKEGLMPRAEKTEKVEDLKERIGASQALLLADFRGLSVHDATELRASLGESGARFSIVKNTLMKRAAADSGMEGLSSLLEGPTAVAFVTGDPVAAAKRFVEAAKKHPALSLKGGFMEGHLLSPADAQALAALESREVMLSKVAGLMKSEMARAARALQALQGRFVSLMGALKDKLPAEAPVAEQAAAEVGSPVTEVVAGPAEEAEPVPPADAERTAEADVEAAADPEVETEPAAEVPAEAEPTEETKTEETKTASELEAPDEEGKE